MLDSWNVPSNYADSVQSQEKWTSSTTLTDNSIQSIYNEEYKQTNLASGNQQRNYALNNNQMESPQQIDLEQPLSSFQPEVNINFIIYFKCLFSHIRFIILLKNLI